MTNHADTFSGDATAPPDGPALDVTGIPAEAFIYPDEPLVLDKFRAALIHPDEPLPPREEEAGLGVGMDGSTKRGAAGTGTVLLDPHQVADLLEAVSVDLRKNGFNSLRRNGGAPSVETNLKTYLADNFSNQH